MLVSYKTAQPQKLPANLEGKTEAELNELGFEVCPDKPGINPGQVLSWEDSSWVVRDPNEAETSIKRTHVKGTIVNRLYASDYKVIKAYEQGIPVDPAWAAYRAELRTLYSAVDTVDPFAIVLPSAPPSGE